MDISELKKVMNSSIIDIIRYLFPNGKTSGSEWIVGDISGKPGKSLKVKLTGPKAGIWSDFATGESGDILELWKAVRGQDTVQAIQDIKSYLNISDSYHSFVPDQKRYVKPQKIEVSKDGEGKVYLLNERKYGQGQ